MRSQARRATEGTASKPKTESAGFVQEKSRHLAVPGSPNPFCTPSRSGAFAYVVFVRCAFAQHIAPAPHSLDEVLAAGGGRQLLAQFADEDVDDLELGLVHATIEMIEEHFLGEGGAFA